MNSFKLVKLFSSKNKTKGLSWETINNYFNQIPAKDIINYIKISRGDRPQLNKHLSTDNDDPVSTLCSNIDHYYPLGGVDKLLLATKIRHELEYMNGLWNIIFSYESEVPAWKKAGLKTEDIIAKLAEEPSKYGQELEDYLEECSDEINLKYPKRPNIYLDDYIKLVECKGNFFGILLKEIEVVLPLQYGRTEKFLNYSIMKDKLRKIDHGLWKMIFNCYDKIPEWKGKDLDEIVYELVGKDKRKYWNEWLDYIIENHMIEYFYLIGANEDIEYDDEYNNDHQKLTLYDLLNIMENELDYVEKKYW